MRRRVSMVLSAMSLTLCLATCVLWVRSYWVIDYLSRQSLNIGQEQVQGMEFFSGDGSLNFLFERTRIPPQLSEEFLIPARQSVVYAHDVPDESDFHWCNYLSDLGWLERHGFSYRTAEVDSALAGHFSWLIRVPHWFVGMLFFAGPALIGWKWLRSFRSRKRGCCAVCGYDLRATRERCPECGTVAKAARPED